jgi:hypothetical protein
LKNDNISADVFWPKDSDPKDFASLLGCLSTGMLTETIFNSAIKHAKKIKEEASIQIIQQILTSFIMNQQQEIIDESDNPIVDPQEAIHHQITMYQQQQS